MKQIMRTVHNLPDHAIGEVSVVPVAHIVIGNVLKSSNDNPSRFDQNPATAASSITLRQKSLVIPVDNALLDVLAKMIEFGCKSEADRGHMVDALARRFERDIAVPAGMAGQDIVQPKYLASITDLPEFAERRPPQWKDRPDKGENPKEYIGREYQPWLGKGLTQAHIRQHDKPLYHALANWLSRSKQKLPADFGLPTQADVTDEILAQADLTPETIIAVSRYQERIRARTKRAQSAGRGAD